MGKELFIAEKPSVAREFAKELGIRGGNGDGCLETDKYIVTWCFGHLVTMSYPDAYDPGLKYWRLDALPFLPSDYKYEVIESGKKQFETVSRLLARDDVDRIYVCTDSGREGEYIYRLVEMMSAPSVKNKDRRRVWIDSFTGEEIQRGIREAKPLSDYDDLAASAYLRAKEDYLMGINFSRVLTLKYGDGIAAYRGEKRTVVAVGRVMTCVLGIVVRREREIRAFVRQPFFRVIGNFDGIEAEWRAVKGSSRENSPALYKENGFKKREDAEALIKDLSGETEARVVNVTRKAEKKQPPLLYNLAELQNDCSRMFRISPDETLKVAQELYEKKLTTYPRTDARVLSSAVAKEIAGNLRGLTRLGEGGENSISGFADEVLAGDAWKSIGKSRYTDDKAITDHYAIIPTGQTGAAGRLSDLSRKVYEQICRRFLAIFFPPAVYSKTAAEFETGGEHFFANAKVLKEEGYLRVLGVPRGRGAGKNDDNASQDAPADESEEALERLAKLRKGSKTDIRGMYIREGETKPPPRYNSGSLILAMENAGQLIEEDELREQIRGSGIGTSATRAEILAKLVRIGYLHLNKKTQIITPELLGEMVYDVVDNSIRPLLSAELTASWEKGLAGVAGGSITTEEYMGKMEGFVARRTNAVKSLNNQSALRPLYDRAAGYYSGGGKAGRNASGGEKRKSKVKT